MTIAYFGHFVPYYFCTLLEMVTYYIVITADVQCKNTNNGLEPVQNMNRCQSDPALNWPDS